MSRHTPRLRSVERNMLGDLTPFDHEGNAPLLSESELPLETREENARLIAAAPELYEAARHAEEWIRATKGHAGAASVAEQLAAALAKVQGSAPPCEHSACSQHYIDAGQTGCVKCNGNHGRDPCNDPECWQLAADPAQSVADDPREWRDEDAP